MSQKVFKIHKSAFKTVEKALGALMNRRVLKRPKHGHYTLAPAQLQLLRSLDSAGRKEIKFIIIISVDKVPDTIPEG